MEFSKKKKKDKGTEIVVSFRLSKEEYEQFKKLTNHYGITMTEMIRQFLNQQYKETFKKNKDE